MGLAGAARLRGAQELSDLRLSDRGAAAARPRHESHRGARHGDRRFPAGARGAARRPRAAASMDGEPRPAAPLGLVLAPLGRPHGPGVDLRPPRGPPVERRYRPPGSGGVGALDDTSTRARGMRSDLRVAARARPDHSGPAGNSRARRARRRQRAARARVHRRDTGRAGGAAAAVARAARLAEGGPGGARGNAGRRRGTGGAGGRIHAPVEHRCRKRFEPAPAAPRPARSLARRTRPPAAGLCARRSLRAPARRRGRVRPAARRRRRCTGAGMARARRALGRRLPQGARVDRPHARLALERSLAGATGAPALSPRRAVPQRPHPRSPSLRDCAITTAISPPTAYRALTASTFTRPPRRHRFSPPWRRSPVCCARMRCSIAI